MAIKLSNTNDNLVMDKYNDFIIEKLHIKVISEAKVILRETLDEIEYKIVDLIVFQNNTISYSGRILGFSNNQIRHRFYNILRKIGRIRNMENIIYPLIDNLNDLLANTDKFDAYLSSSDKAEVAYTKNLIKRGICFLCLIKNNEFRFYPSRFIGYKENTIFKHKSNTTKDGRITNSRISSILDKQLEINDLYDFEFTLFCQELGIVPDNKQRKYWIVSQPI